jgi:hypothetical protein
LNDGPDNRPAAAIGLSLYRLLQQDLAIFVDYSEFDICPANIYADIKHQITPR